MIHHILIDAINDSSDYFDSVLLGIRTAMDSSNAKAYLPIYGGTTDWHEINTTSSNR